MRNSSAATVPPTCSKAAPERKPTIHGDARLALLVVGVLPAHPMPTFPLAGSVNNGQRGEGASAVPQVEVVAVEGEDVVVHGEPLRRRGELSGGHKGGDVGLEVRPGAEQFTAGNALIGSRMAVLSEPGNRRGFPIDRKETRSYLTRRVPFTAATALGSIAALTLAGAIEADRISAVAALTTAVTDLLLLRPRS